MKRIIFTLAATLLAVVAQAQPMGGRPPMGGGRPPMGMMGGGMGKPFYELESDSIADARIVDVAGRLDLSEKQYDKMVKLYKQEFEEICHNLQMTVMEYQMRANGGFGGRGMGGLQQIPTTVTMDTETAKKTYDEIIKKFDKRYKKALEPDQYETWKTLSGTTLDNKFNSIFQHVQENTESFF